MVDDQSLPAEPPAAMRDGRVKSRLINRSTMFVERFGPVGVSRFIADLDLSVAGSATDCRFLQSTGNGETDRALCGQS